MRHEDAKKPREDKVQKTLSKSYRSGNFFGQIQQFGRQGGAFLDFHKQPAQFSICFPTVFQLRFVMGDQAT